jgi:CRP-like cAMP-binding protein
MLYFKEGRAMTLHKEGDIMGWSTIVTPFQYKGTAVALTDGEVLSMSGQEFLQLIQGNSSIGDKIMKKINKIIAERMPFITGPKQSEGN